MLWLLLSVACGPSCVQEPGLGLDDTAGDAIEPAPAPLTMVRLTEPQLRLAIADVTGVWFEGTLPVDYRLHGYTTVGGGTLSISPYDLELYEAMAWDVAAAWLPDQQARLEVMGCDPDEVSPCLRPWLSDTGLLAWRRPLSTDELDQLEALYDLTEQQIDNPSVAAQATAAALLLSPELLFRVERGTAVDDVLMLTDLELASRMAFFLTDAPPDDALLALAVSGTLSGDVLEAAARRLMASERGQDAFTRWFAETFTLDELATVDKDPVLHPEMDDALRQAMRDELEWLFGDVVFGQGADYAELFVTDATNAEGPLAALYGISGAGTIPADQERGGILGRAGMMALASHSTRTSPTERGKLVQSRVFCRAIPPPPEGITSEVIDGDEAEGSLRDKLERHATDPACSSCHEVMDPIGYAFEHFDPIGQWRPDDNGYTIDATGHIDGDEFDGAAELGALVAAHAELSLCTSTLLYRHALGQAEQRPQLPSLEALASGMDADGRLTELAVSLIRSDTFRTATRPDGAPCAGIERCDGLDEDCDGLVDEGVERSCDAEFGAGMQTCTEGDWSDCDGPPPPPETCNGLDDDLDGEIDEDLDVFVLQTTAEALAEDGHPDCDVDLEGDSGACRAAVHRICASSGCAVSGYGVVDYDEESGAVDVSCFSGIHAIPTETTYTALTAQHVYCAADGQRWGVDCNASIHRECQSLGLLTGYGPLESDGDNVLVGCTPTATAYLSTYTVLAEHAAGCDGATERGGLDCNRAIHELCQDEGFATGHGPLENSGDSAWLACVPLEAP